VLLCQTPVISGMRECKTPTAHTIGLLRAKVKIGMMNLVYNMMRLVQLTRRKGEVAPAIA